MILLVFSLVTLILSAFAEPNMKELTGTWSSKSNTVFTGPGFYDPVDELLIEPDLPGISYSFTEDGHFEEALYRVVSNPRKHECPTALLIYQHGTYEILNNGSVVLTPIAVDGRQLVSDPCNEGNSSVYSRYVQPTLFRTFQVYLDNYAGRLTLQIYQFDGSVMQPLYLAYRPPLMLPTYALNPTNKASKTKSSLRKRIKRSLENKYRTNAFVERNSSYDYWWWVSVALIGASSAALLLR